MRSVFGLLLLPLLASASPLGVETIHNEAAPLLSSVDAKVIPDSYMVVFKDHVTKSSASAHHLWVDDMHTQYNTELRKRSQWTFMSTAYEGLKHTYHIPGGLLGYSGHFGEDVIDQIRRHPDVAYIEKDSEVHTLEGDDGSIEIGAPWGLARISHRDSLGFSTFNKYLFAAEGGDGVDVYVIDTGTNIKHVEFEGRASWGKTIPSGDEDLDGNGHGTHCSGTVAGKKFGVAKKAHIKAVKVLRSNGSGSMSDVVKGVEYAAEAHLDSVSAAQKGKKKGFKGSAANMSLGGGKSTVLDKSVNAAVDVGIHFAVAAGNDNADSCNYSPAAAEKAVTVGASTIADERAYFSNFGTCNDIFAPGLNILSTWIGSDTATNTISGTSMASPHIAGLLAYLLSLQPAKDSAYAVAEITPKKLKADLLAIATDGALTDVPSNTKNILAWNGAGHANYTEIISAASERARNSHTIASGVVAEVEQDAKIIKGIFEDKASETQKYTAELSSDVEEQLDVLTGQLEDMNEKLEDFIAEELKHFQSV